MNCNLNNVITLMAVMAALIVAAIAAALVSLLIPAPWDAVILVGAAIAAAGALAMINAIESAFQAYQTCRDQENSPSQCSTVSINAHFGALRVLMGIAVAGFVTAAVAALVPAVGDLVGLVPLSGALIACLIALLLLISLSAFLSSYANCRDEEAQDNGPGDPPGTMVEPGVGIVGNVTRQQVGKSSKSSDTQK
ncbi:MAG: hypothetical protein BroJett011_77650 [Chloroflexota bacterium]|nr:MAG: hypothetical protein BroJett011_77650 [Chloroflexota bacterium]